MKNKIKAFIKKITTPKSKKKLVSVKEVKEIYKGFSKNQLIRVIIRLSQENAMLRYKKGMIKKWLNTF